MAASQNVGWITDSSAFFLADLFACKHGRKHDCWLAFCHPAEHRRREGRWGGRVVRFRRSNIGEDRNGGFQAAFLLACLHASLSASLIAGRHVCHLGEWLGEREGRRFARFGPMVGVGRRSERREGKWEVAPEHGTDSRPLQAVAFSGKVCTQLDVRARISEVAKMMRKEGFVSVKEAAELLDVAPNTVRAWGAAGKITEYRHPANNYRLYERRELEELLVQVRTPTKLKSR